MFTKKYFLLCMLVLFVSGVAMAMAYNEISINDGASHVFDDDTYLDHCVVLDEFIPNDPGTHIDLNAGCSVGAIAVYNNATVSVDGGSVIPNRPTLVGHEHSSGYLTAYDNSTVTMCSGSVIGLRSKDNAVIYLNGGSVIHLTSRTNGMIYIDGTDFEVTSRGVSTSLSYGDRLSNYGDVFRSSPSGNDQITARIKGTLADGSVLNVRYHISNTGDYEGTADIIIIPEPASLLLLSLGGLILRVSKGSEAN